MTILTQKYTPVVAVGGRRGLTTAHLSQNLLFGQEIAIETLRVGPTDRIIWQANVLTHKNSTS